VTQVYVSNDKGTMRRLVGWSLMSLFSTNTTI